MEGNYWSDYNKKGTYSIAGSAGATDPYPLLNLYCYDEVTDTNGSSFIIRLGLFLFIIGILVVPLIIRKTNGQFNQ